MALDIFKELGLDDDTTINNAIAKLERLNNAIEVMAANARKSSETYSNALDSISKSADTLEKSLSELDATNKKDQSTIASQSKQVDELSSDYDKYTKSLKLNEAELLALIAAQDKLTSSKEKLKKGTTDEAGSLNDLRKQLTETVKAYQAMGTATDQSVKDSTLTKIKDLSKAVNETDKALKEAKKGADAAAGSYDALSAKVISSRRELKAMEGGIGNTSKEFKALQTQIKADAEALRDFDKSMGDSRPNVGNYESALAGLDQTTGGMIGRVQQLGKAFLNLLANPVVAFVALLAAGFMAAKSAVTEFYTSTGEGEDQLEEQQGLWNTFFTSIRNGWSDAGKAITEFIGLNKQNMQGIYAAILAFAGLDAALAKYLNSVEESNRLVKEKQDLDDQIYDITIKQSEIQLQKSKLLLESNDKLVYSDVERLAKKKEIAVLSESELQNNLKRAKVELDIATTEVALTKSMTKAQFDLLTIEQKRALFKGADLQKIADATAKLSDVEAQSYQERKKNEAQIIGLTLEIEKAKRDAANAEKDTQREVSLYLIEANKKQNEEIIKDDNNAYLTRQKAIDDNRKFEQDRLEIAKQKEIDIVTRAAEEQARASVPTKDVQSVVANNIALKNSIEKITNAYKDLEVANADLYDKAIEKNIFMEIAKQAAIADDKLKILVDEDLIALGEQFNKNLISYRQYEDRKSQIMKDGNELSIRDQIFTLNQQLDNITGNEKEKLDIQRKIKDLEVILEDNKNKDILESRKKLAAASQQILNETLNFVKVSLAAESEIRIQEGEKQLEDLAIRKDARIKIVGDDKQAQSAIEADFAQKQKVIQDKINKEKHDAAVKEKALNLVQAIINTARAVTAALPNYPLAILTGIIGGLQVAAIAKQSIPAYAVGTEYSAEGLALVGEAGREIVYDRKTRKAQLYDTPTVTFLSKGSIVKNNKTTEDILSMADVEGINNTYSRDLEYVAEQRRLEFKTAGIIASVDGMRAEVVDAVKYAGGQHVFDELGYRKYNTDKGGKVLSLNKRYQQNG